MTAPTQAFPPWLSPSPFTVTQDGTVVVQTTVIQFPQTYYGPSIPLGPDWVFGGSTFPASIATSFASPTSTLSSTSTSSLSQTATTSITSSTLTPTLTSLTTSTSSPSQSASISSSTNPSESASSSSPSSSSSPTNSSHGLSSGTRLAIILSTVLGTLLLVALAIVLCRVRRRRRRQQEHFPITQEFHFSNWQLVNPSTAHQPLERATEEGEGSAFLTDEQAMQERAVGPILTREWSDSSSQHPQVGEPTALSREISSGSSSESGAAKSDSSTLDSASKREVLTRLNASASTVAAGSLFFNPARGNDEASGVRRSDEDPVQETETSLIAANVPSSSENRVVRPPGTGPPHVPSRSPDRPHIDPNSNPPMSPEDDDAEEEFRPPRLLDPDRVFQLQNQPSGGSRGSWVYPDSPPSENDERATLLTAQRIDVGSVAHPVLASPPSEKKSLEDFTNTLDVEPDNHVVETPPSPRSWVGMGGLTGFARGLGRLSWFRRMEEVVGSSGTRRSSSPLGNRGSGSKPTSRPGSRPTSGVGFTGPTSGNRRYSGLLHPTFTPRPRSDASFRGIEAELGMRPPGIRFSGTGSGSGGSGSGKSGRTAYHSASSRPQTPMYTSGVHELYEGELLHPLPTPVTLPPELDLGEGDSTIRSVDVLDLPVPERALPFTDPLRPEPALRPDTASSRGTGLVFPPGLVTVPQWDRGSHSSSSNRREERDLLEDDPPQAGGEWSSLRSKHSSSDVEEDGNRVAERRGGPMTRHSTGEQAVQVITGDHAASETASFSSALRRADPSSSASLRSPTGPSLIFTPSVSVYASSHSHSGSGSHSSRPSQHTTLHSHELSQHSSFQESEDGHLLARGPASHRASLSAMGGESGPPPLPHFRALSQMQPTIEVEDESVGSTSRPNTGTSRPTMSEATYTGTLASGSTGTGAPTAVPSMTNSTEKR